MERIENGMLMERSFEKVVEELKSFDTPGWTNTTDGTFVLEEDAFDYAIDHCTNFVPSGLHKIEWTDDFREMVVEWFYSGGEWKKVE